MNSQDIAWHDPREKPFLAEVLRFDILRHKAIIPNSLLQQYTGSFDNLLYHYNIDTTQPYSQVKLSFLDAYLYCQPPLVWNEK